MPKIGPPNGSLVLAEGGSKALSEITSKFIVLAGGFGAPIVIVPTAHEEDYYGPYTPYTEDLMDAGALNLRALESAGHLGIPEYSEHVDRVIFQIAVDLCFAPRLAHKNAAGAAIRLDKDSMRREVRDAAD